MLRRRSMQCSIYVWCHQFWWWWNMLSWWHPRGIPHPWEKLIRQLIHYHPMHEWPHFTADLLPIGLMRPECFFCLMYLSLKCVIIEQDDSLIARFVRPTWGPSGADRTQVGPMLAPWTLLSGWYFSSCRASVSVLFETRSVNYGTSSHFNSFVSTYGILGALKDSGGTSTNALCYLQRWY